MRYTKQNIKSYYNNYIKDCDWFLLLGVLLLPFFIITLLFCLWLDFEEKYLDL